MKLSQSLSLATLAAIVSAQTAPNFPFNVTRGLQVYYPVSRLNVTPGEYIGSASVPTQPTVYLPANASATTTWIVFMIDTSVVYQGRNTSVLQWYQPNLVAGRDSVSLQVNAASNSSASNSSVGASYYPVIPPAGPPHSYTFLLYVQPPNYTVPANYSQIIAPTLIQRLGFNITDYQAAAHLGSAYAATYFYGYDSAASYPNGTALPNATSSTSGTSMTSTMATTGSTMSTTATGTTSRASSASSTAAATSAAGAVELRSHGQDWILGLVMGAVGAGMWLL